MPRLLLTPLIIIFSRIYSVELTEATQQVSEFRTFNEFFTRQLLPDARPLDPDLNAILSPVDGFIGEYGRINDGRLIQAKGLDYRLADLLLDSKRDSLYDGGEFITIYLAPQNYHRIHSMVEGEVREFSYIPGDLWTVSPLGVHHVPKLFARNERLTTYIQTEKGECALIKVGATVVGRIRVSFHDQISNRHGSMAKQLVLKTPFKLERGDEVGLFELGSTVICLFPPGQVKLNVLELGQKICLGQAIGRFKPNSNE
jgi:phosphatidylserine decarboxylase